MGSCSCQLYFRSWIVYLSINHLPDRPQSFQTRKVPSLDYLTKIVFLDILYEKTKSVVTYEDGVFEFLGR